MAQTFSRDFDRGFLRIRDRRHLARVLCERAGEDPDRWIHPLSSQRNYERWLDEADRIIAEGIR